MLMSTGITAAACGSALKWAKEELPVSIFSKTQKKTVSNSVLRNIKALKTLLIFSAVKLEIKNLFCRSTCECCQFFTDFPCPAFYHIIKSADTF